MKKLDFVLDHFKSQCLDGRDAYRLAEYTPKDKLHILELSLREGVSHTPKEWSTGNIMEDLNKDLQFGYQKALNGRGISTALMISVVEMWDWILDDDENILGNSELDTMDPLTEFRAIARKYYIDLEEMK